MAIQDETGSGANQTNMGAAMGRAQQNGNDRRAGNRSEGAPSRSPNPTHERGGERGQRERKSFSQMGSAVRRAMPLSGAGEALARTQKVMLEAIEAQKDGSQAVEATLLALDPQQYTGLPIGYLVMCVQMVDNTRLGVGYQPIIIDASLDNISAAEITVNGQKVEVLRTAENADTDQVRDIVHAAVCDRFGTDQAFGAMAMVLPRIFNLDDKLHVKNLTAQSAFAAAIELQRHTGLLEPLDLTEFGSADETLITNLNFDGEQELNLVDQPTRGDIKIGLVSEPTNRNSQQNVLSLGSGAAVELARSQAFVDFVYQPKIDPNTIYTAGTWGNNMGVNPDVWRKFIPRIIFTDLRAERLTTLGGQLLALASALGVRNNRLWMGAFAPDRTKAGEVDYRDIGALNIEANWTGDPTQLGAPFDTKADNFTMGSLAQVIDAVCQDGLLFSIDVSERGPDTWYNGVWAAADEGDENAEAAIIQAADDLTHGAFSEFFPNNAPVTLRMNETILLGYYKAKSGELRDIREIDYLALLNLYGQTRKDIVDDYSDTIVRVDHDEALRLEARMNILRKATSNAVFTGRGRRVTCSSEFIVAFTKAVEATRITMPIRAPHFDTTTSRRAVGQYGAGMVSGYGSSTLYSRSTGPSVSGGSSIGSGGYRNRWGN
jgi:hypothetical protein